MILPKDFQIEVGTTERGTFVRVLHKPTGKQRLADPVRRGEPVDGVRDRLVREIRGELYRNTDVRVDIGRADAGTFVRVVHLPTGKSRLVCPLGKQSFGHLQLTMLDEILEELAREGEGQE